MLLVGRSLSAKAMSKVLRTRQKTEFFSHYSLLDISAEDRSLSRGSTKNWSFPRSGRRETREIRSRRLP